MTKISRDFQIFAKPAGAACNLSCHYCYYLGKEQLYPGRTATRMADDVLENYIRQHIDASPNPLVHFHWHGGEPTILGVDYYRRITELQRKHKPAGARVVNAMQTNGTLIDEEWCRFFSREDFTIGLSLDGPEEMHDAYRVTKQGRPTQRLAMRAYHLLCRHRVPCDILCVVSANNVEHPAGVYRFFKRINAEYVGFLPLVEPLGDADGGVSDRTVPSMALGTFFSTIFDEWKREDIGRIVIQNFEEVAKTALGEEHALCIFRRACGDVPAIEHNGDYFSCDHYVDLEHCLGNIQTTRLVDLIESPEQRAFGDAKWESLPRHCMRCEVLDMCNGGCPKDRFSRAPDGEDGLNYLCEGYRHFFNHCRSFAAALAAQSQRALPSGRMPLTVAPSQRPRDKVGRNDPCPCGSGLKYKKCCLPKSIT